jgi:ABC-type Fe3+-hydroxamate transport system substrate-binding protein
MVSTENLKIKITIILLDIFVVLLTLITPSEARIVTDQLGRKISLPDNPQRIVALAPSITEIIYALGQQHRPYSVITRMLPKSYPLWDPMCILIWKKSLP